MMAVLDLKIASDDDNDITTFVSTEGQVVDWFDDFGIELPVDPPLLPLEISESGIPRIIIRRNKPPRVKVVAKFSGTVTYANSQAQQF